MSAGGRSGVRMVAVVVAIGLVAGGVVVGLRWSMGRSAGGSSASAVPVVTAPITRMTLVETATIDGTLGHGPAEPVESRAGGTLTWLPDTGTVLRRGDVLLRADERPVVLLYGTLPMYRALTLDAIGTDVEQFEANLYALGFTGFTVDTRYSSGTATAVRRWQRHLGVPETGVVDLAAVVYAPGPARIASRLARLGTSATGPVLTRTAEARMVTAPVPAAGAVWAVAGTQVSVLLPGGRTVPGVVAQVGTAPDPDATGSGAARGGDADAGATVTITIADQAAIGPADRVPVTVRFTSRERRDVLTVSVAALLAPIEGGYAIEVVDGDRTRVIPVEVGLFADGRVEISGTGVDAGLLVRLPA